MNKYSDMQRLNFIFNTTDLEYPPKGSGGYRFPENREELDAIIDEYKIKYPNIIRLLMSEE